MILVDSSVWIDYFNGTLNTPTDFLDKILGKELIIVGDIILLEVLQGFRSDRDYAIAHKSLEVFPFRNMLGKVIALKSAQNFRFLRKRGITVRKMIDIIIGTFCIENNFELLYSDKDFGPLVDQLNLRNALPKK
jgi:predicted nucleic acid-binding protein